MLRRSLSVSAVIAVLAALTLMIAPTAVANHGDRLLEVTPELNAGSAGDTLTLTASLSTAAAETPPTEDSSIDIDFEVIGPSPETTTHGDPDGTCTVLEGDTDCTVGISRGPGQFLVRGWIDDDKTDGNELGVTEADTTEGRYSGLYAYTPPPVPTYAFGDCTSDDADPDCPTESPQTSEPGATAEPDITDVVSINFTTEPDSIDCDPENELNEQGTAETYTCTVRDTEGTPMGGMLIDGENRDGANDPDDADATPADYDDICTTGTAGSCSFDIGGAAFLDTGRADMCFWPDSNNDDVYDLTDGGDPADGGDCYDEDSGDREGFDMADVVVKWWRDNIPANHAFNFDIARDIEFLPFSSGTAGYVLDGWGALHPFGGAPPIEAGPYWSGWDIARDFEIDPRGFFGCAEGYILDGWGAKHPWFAGSGSGCELPDPITDGPYWPGWDIARDLEMDDGFFELDWGSGYVLDGWGAVHDFGADSASVSNPGYSPGQDIWRDVELIDNDEGYALNGFGAVRAFGGASAMTGTPSFGFDIARDLELVSWNNLCAFSSPCGGEDGGWILDGFGGIHPTGDVLGEGYFVDHSPYTGGSDQWVAFEFFENGGKMVDHFGTIAKFEYQ